MTSVVRLDEVLPAEGPVDDPAARVGVVVSLNFPDLGEETAALVRRFTRVTLESLQHAGAEFELFDTSVRIADPGSIVACDGLLLLGGGDIDPTCYGPGLTEVPNSYGIDLQADRDAMRMIGIAEEAELPILGICRGSQLINVHRGGTIVPDIDDYSLHRGGPGEPIFIDEKIGIEEGTRLRAVLDADQILARSGHHQAVDDVGRGLVVAARALDGIVEAIEDPDRWIVGVQWHPEDDDAPVEDRRRLMSAFVAACAERRNQNSRCSEERYRA